LDKEEEKPDDLLAQREAPVSVCPQ